MTEPLSPKKRSEQRKKLFKALIDTIGYSALAGFIATSTVIASSTEKNGDTAIRPVSLTTKLTVTTPQR